jgi:hypothetical protein
MTSNPSWSHPTPARALRGVPWILGGLFLFNMVLLTPGWVVAGELGGRWLAFEALIVVGLMAVLPAGRWRWIPAGGLALAALAFLVVGLGHAAARLSLDRQLNLYLDVHLIGAVWNLLVGNVGLVPALLLTGAAGGAALLVTLGLAWILVRATPGPRRAVLETEETAAPARTGPSRAVENPAGADVRPHARPDIRPWIDLRALVLPGRLLGVTLLLAAIFPLVALAGSPGSIPPGEETVRPSLMTRALAPVEGWTGLPVVQLTREQIHQFERMMGERERFAAEMAAAPASYRDRPGLLARVGGRDVLVAFIESYGISAVYDDRYEPIVAPRLQDLEARVEASGLHMASGRLRAPSQGGQSWFGHGTLLGGLWLDNQLRYDLLLASGRDTMVDDFRAAGYRTVTLMPAITLAWPEGERFGFDRIYAHRDIGYAGPPLNWVTMPDQFTWWYLERSIRREAPDPRPLFAVIGLISSHAPWTPILPVLDDWEGLGDGDVFAPWENAGEPPAELWRDSDRVREHFALSVDYALHAMAGYVERYVDEGTLLIALGDHQPAPLITGEGASRDVPIHVIAGDPALLDPFLAWGFIPGAFPAREEEGLGMEEFRRWFVEAFSSEGRIRGSDR